MSPAARMSWLGWNAIVLPIASSLMSSGVSRIFGALGSSSVSSCKHTETNTAFSSLWTAPTAFSAVYYSLKCLLRLNYQAFRLSLNAYWNIFRQTTALKRSILYNNTKRTCSNESSCSMEVAIFIVCYICHFRQLLHWSGQQGMLYFYSDFYIFPTHMLTMMLTRMYVKKKKVTLYRFCVLYVLHQNLYFILFTSIFYFIYIILYLVLFTSYLLSYILLFCFIMFVYVLNSLFMHCQTKENIYITCMLYVCTNILKNIDFL